MAEDFSSYKTKNPQSGKVEETTAVGPMILSIFGDLVGSVLTRDPLFSLKRQRLQEGLEEAKYENQMANFKKKMLETEMQWKQTQIQREMKKLLQPDLTLQDVIGQETEEVPAPLPGEGKGMFPLGATVQQPTGKPTINWGKVPVEHAGGVASAFEKVYPTQKKEPFTLGKGQRRYDAQGNIIAEGPPESEITPYQEKSLKLREEEGAANRALREQESKANRELREEMFKQNIAIRKALLDLRKTQITRVPPNIQKGINDKITKLDQYTKLIDSYEDKYGGSVMLGPTVTEIYSRTGGQKDRVNWWKQWRLLDSEVRHELFGATLTGFEKQSWDAITVSENTSPAIAREAMQNRIAIALNALDREIEGFSAAGYEVQPPAPRGKGKTIKRTGTDKKTGKKVIEYTDGSIEYAK